MFCNSTANREGLTAKLCHARVARAARALRRMALVEAPLRALPASDAVLKLLWIVAKFTSKRFHKPQGGLNYDEDLPAHASQAHGGAHCADLVRQEAK